MRPLLLRRTLVASLVLAALAAAGPAGAASPLAKRLGTALRAAALDGSRTGAIAVDLSTGQVVFAQNAAASLVPASNEKIAVTYGALVALGPSFRMRTEVVGEGRLEGATWQGNLVLKGYGDPTLDRFGLRDLAHQLRHLGIRRVTGPLVVDETYFDSRRTGPGWKPSFYREECDPLSALAVGRAVLSDEPALEAAEVFRTQLARVGITVAGPTRAARAGGFPLAVHWSPPLTEILREMDVESDNFLAEIVLKQLGALLAGTGTTAAGAAIVRGVLAQAGIPLRGVVIADGSGLSALDRMTPRSLIAILQRAWTDDELRPVFVSLLPRAGRDGTLEHRLRNAPARDNVRAKTGTLDKASSLSGFVRDRYAFAIIQNGRELSADAAHSSQDRFATLLAVASK